MKERTWTNLQKLSDDELVAEHDELARNTQVGTQYYLDELRYRRQEHVASQVGKLTKKLYCLTVVVTVLTAVVTAATIFGVVRVP